MKYRIKEIIQTSYKGIVYKYYQPQYKFLFWWCDVYGYSNNCSYIEDAQRLIEYDIRRREREAARKFTTTTIIHKYP